jgi:hypothetical protein
MMERQGEIKSCDYAGEQAENSVAIVAHKCVVRSVVTKIAYNNRIIAIKLEVEPINIMIMPCIVHANIRV